MKLRWVLATAFVLLLDGPLLAQSGSPAKSELASGLRLGGSSGATLKKYAKNGGSALEFIVGYNFDPKVNNLGITGLYEKLVPLAGNKLNAQIGGGPTWVFRDTRIGVSGILGFDWRLTHAPVSLSVDWAPTFFFVNRTGFSPLNGAFSARYIFNRKTPRRPRVPATVSPSGN
jgi:hypothetical protein